MAGPALRALLLLAACLSCLHSSVEAAPAVAREARVTELASVAALDGYLRAGRLVFVAFVNPLLPASAKFHSTLHELRHTFENSSSVMVAFTDVGAQRQFVAKYGLRSVPSLKLFFPMLSSRQPIPIEFNENTTAPEYAAQIRQYALSADANSGIAGPALPAAVDAVRRCHRSEWESLTKARQAQAAAAAAEAAGETAAVAEATPSPAPAAAPAAEADVAAGAAVVAADGSVVPSVDAPPAATPTPHPYESVLHALRVERAHVASAAAIADAKLAALEEAVSLLGSGGTAAVAKFVHAKMDAFVAVPVNSVNVTEGAVFADTIGQLHVLQALLTALRK